MKRIKKGKKKRRFVNVYNNLNRFQQKGCARRIMTTKPGAAVEIFKKGRNKNKINAALILLL